MYDNNAHFYDFFEDKTSEILVRENILKPYLNPHFHLLEIGCGTGNFAIELVKKNFKITCIEPSIAMLNILEKNIQKQSYNREKLTVINKEAQKFQCPHSFDLAFAWDMFFLLNSPEEQLMVLKNIYQHLKSNAHLIFNFSLEGSGETKVRQQIGERMKESVIYKHFSASESIDSKHRKVTWTFETWKDQNLIESTSEDFIIYKNSKKEIEELIRVSFFKLLSNENEIVIVKKT